MAQSKLGELDALEGLEISNKMDSRTNVKVVDHWKEDEVIEIEQHDK